MSSSAGPYMFSYNSKNTLNRIIFDGNRRRREGLEGGSASPAQVNSSFIHQKYVVPSHLGRKTPLQTRFFQSSLDLGVDESQQQPHEETQSDAYMRKNESTLVSPGHGERSRTLVSPQPESSGMVFDDCIVRWKDCNNRLVDKYAEMSQKLSDLRQKHEETTQTLHNTETQLKASCKEVSSMLVEIKTETAEKHLLEKQWIETKAQLNALTQDNDRLKAQLVAVNLDAERAKTGLATNKARLGQLSESFAALGSGFHELGQARSASQESIHLIRKEFEEIRKQVVHCLEVLRPILDEGGTLTRAQETKILLKDLQESLDSSHQVTDMLRSKILHQASQLADAQARVKELEEASLSKMLAAAEDNKEHLALLVEVGKKVEDVTAKVISQERETVGALVASASWEASVEALSKELETGKALCATHGKEREENVSKLLSLQNTINGRDRDIAVLKSELRGLKDSKEELRILLAEAKKELADREVELRARDPNVEFQLKIEGLTEELGLANVRLQEAEMKYKTSSVQEIFFKKRLHESEGVSMILRASSEKLQTNLLTTRAELSTLGAGYKTCQEELRMKKDEISKLQEECNGLHVQHRELEVRMEEKDKQLHVQGRRASAAEDSVVWAKDQLSIANLKHKELEGRLESISREAALAKETAGKALASIENESRAQITILEDRILELEKLNARANGRAEKLTDLYRTGQLTDAERSFVSHIIGMTEALREEEIVRKDNELRLRDISLEKMKNKLTTAQETVRRLVAEKNVQGNTGMESIVDLRNASSEANKTFGELDTLSEISDEEEDNKVGIKRSRSPSPRKELPKRSKRPLVTDVGKKNKGRKKK